MSTARNDACPCGSGKKYKKCHGAPERAAPQSGEVTRANTLKARDTDLTGRLLRFARKRHGADWLKNALEQEGLDAAGEVADADVSIIVPWLLHFRFAEKFTTLAEEWSADARDRVSHDDDLILEAYHDAWISIWEVAEVVPGTGSRLVDLLTREERFVHDVSSASTLQRFDTLLAIVLTVDGVSFFGGLHTQPLPPRFAEPALQEARRLCRVRTRAVAPEKLREPGLQLDLIFIWGDAVDDMRDRPLPVMQNTDGDPMQLTSDDFALVGSRDAVARKLSAIEGAEEPEEEGGNTVFTVTKAGNVMNSSWNNTIVGRLVLSNTRLTVETNSVRRADSLRAAIEAGLAGLIRFRLRKEENTALLMEEARENASTAGAKPQAPLPPDAEAAVRDFRERHMRAWLDESIPALGGMTPRQAARAPAARRKLETLLKEIERNEAGQPGPMRIEVRWLWEELGFE